MRLRYWYLFAILSWASLIGLADALTNMVWADEVYLEIGLAMKVNGSDVLMDNCYYVPKFNVHGCGGRNPAGILELGYSWDSGWSVFYLHRSGWRDGVPFNDNAETYLDMIGVSKRWSWRTK